MQSAGTVMGNKDQLQISIYMLTQARTLPLVSQGTGRSHLRAVTMLRRSAEAEVKAVFTEGKTEEA